MSNKKNYVIDTSVIMHDPFFYKNFDDNNIIIPIKCIEELGNLKERDGIKGFQARQAVHALDELRKLGNLHKGIALENSGTLRVELNHQDTKCLSQGLDKTINDNRILAVAKNIASENYDIKTILVTKDACFRIIAESEDVEVEDYKNDKIVTDEVYKGYIEWETTSSEIERLKSGKQNLPEGIEKLYPNQFVLLKAVDKNSSLIMINKKNKLVQCKNANRELWDITPQNMEQKMAVELLLDTEIPLVTITGGAGSGKTLLSIATALEEVTNSQQYRKIMIVRPTIAAGNDIGYLPGNKDEKMRPWLGSFYDNIDVILNGKEKTESTESFVDGLKQKEILEVEALTYMRGRTFNNTFIILDETQLITPHLAKMFITRAGENTKIVCLGDPTDNQIDNPFVDSKSNGLVYTVEKMKEYDVSGHITLRKIERSPLVKIAEKYM